MADIKFSIHDFKQWLERDFSPKDVVEEDTSQSSSEYRVFVYTQTNRYCIVAKQYDDGGYLGCTATSRKARPGEQQFRGNDLPDGKLTEQTWYRILVGIVRYELQTICRQTETAKTASADTE